MNTSKIMLRVCTLVVLLAFALSIPGTQANTLEIYVNPTTWAYSSSDVGGGGPPAVENFSVTSGSETRYYFAGNFDVVNVRNMNFNGSLYPILQTISPCNNICYISGTNVYALTVGFNGSGNGVSGPILVAAKFSNGDLYIGGSFTLAGGNSHANRFSCYRFSSGWSGVNEIEVTGGNVTGFSFVNYKLKVEGTFNEVHGPTTSGGSVYSGLTGLPSVAYWNEWHQTFPNSYWTAN
jgi:hypothetical protein